MSSGDLDMGGALIAVALLVGLIFATYYGWMAPNIATTEEVCSFKYNVLCTSSDQGCKTGVDLINKTICSSAHLPASTKAESWSVGGMIALCVLLYIIGEVIIIRKARKGEWAHTEWGFIGVNVLALLIIVAGVGAVNLGQASVSAWMPTIDWMATLIWFLYALLYICSGAFALLMLYIFKRTLWDTFVVPAREKEIVPPYPINPRIIPTNPKHVDRPKGSKKKRRVGRPKKVR